jgi:hypothetical protein
LIQPTRLIGCAWDYAPMPPGLVFEVWSSTNLIHWYLATNTTEKIARFPMKPCEFWKVRARDTNGLRSQGRQHESKVFTPYRMNNRESYRVKNANSI